MHRTHVTDRRQGAGGVDPLQHGGTLHRRLKGIEGEVIIEDDKSITTTDVTQDRKHACYTS